MLAGTYTVAAAITLTNAGTATAPIIHVGCLADGTIITPKRFVNGNHGESSATGTGDLDSSTWPALNVDAGVAVIGTNKAFHHYMTLKVTGAISGYLWTVGAGTSYLEAIDLENTSSNSAAGGFSITGANSTVIRNCDAKVPTTGVGCFSLTAANTYAFKCRGEGGTFGFITGGRGVMSRCTAFGNLTAGFDTTAATGHFVLDECTAYGTADCFLHSTSAGTAPLYIFDSHFTDGTGYAFNSSVASNTLVVRNTRVARNATAVSQNYGDNTDIWSLIQSAATSVGQDYADSSSASRDFRLVGGAAGKLLKTLGGDLGANEPNTIDGDPPGDDASSCGRGKRCGY